MANKKKAEADNPLETIERNIEVVGPEDENNYTIIVETTVKTDDGTANQIVNLFTRNATDAYSWLMNLTQLYDQPGIVGVKLIGIYRRTTLSVVDEGDRNNG